MEKIINIFVPDKTQDALVTVYDDSVRNFLEHNQTRANIRFVDSPNDADIVIVFEEFSFKVLDYANTLLASPLFLNHASKIYTINYDDIGQGFLPGCYTSLRTDNFNPDYHRACVYPFSYNEFAIAGDLSVEPRQLFSFRGTTKTNPCRKRLVSSLAENNLGSVNDIDQQFHTHDDDQKQEYVNEILQSKFVLCPRGWSPSTYRVYEVMSLGRCPVIISDQWIAPAGIEWGECSVIVAENDISRIPEILLQAEDNWQKLGNKAAIVWAEHFSESARYRNYLDDVVSLYHSHSQLRAEHANSVAAYQKRWASKSFRSGNGWTLSQKITRKLFS